MRLDYLWILLLATTVSTIGYCGAMPAVCGADSSDRDGLPEPGPTESAPITSVSETHPILTVMPTCSGAASQANRCDQTGRQPTNGTIRALYPNPPAYGDPGEYLRVYLPIRGNWSLTDGHTTASIPVTARGEIVVSENPEAAARHVDEQVISLEGRIQLADDGDRVVLKRGDEPADVVAYERAGQGQVWSHNQGWHPVSYEPRPPVDCGPAEVTGFLLPDANEAPVDRLGHATERVFLAAYTFASQRTAEVLISAAQRGVDVRLLVDRAPVGGVSNRSAEILDRVARSDVEVKLAAGSETRFRFHHAKYAIIDERALVTTENWKPSGTGGRSNRGWGVVVTDSRFADELAAVFTADAGQRQTTRWSTYRSEREFSKSTPATESFPSRFDPRTADAASVELLTAPGNAESRLVERIDAADRRVCVIIPNAGGTKTALVQAAIRAASRGVSVTMLLSDAWYHSEDNAALTSALRQTSPAQNGNLTVKVADPRGRYGKIHAKGVVIDDTVVVGSLNWNDHSATNNREVVAVVESHELAEYFATAFGADWRGGSRLLPVGVAVWFLCVAGGAAWLGHRTITFESH